MLTRAYRWNVVAILQWIKYFIETWTLYLLLKYKAKKDLDNDNNNSFNNYYILHGGKSRNSSFHNYLATMDSYNYVKYTQHGHKHDSIHVYFILGFSKKKNCHN